MSQEMVGKELVLDPEEFKGPAKKSEPTLMQVGRGWICSTGKFHPALAVKYIHEKPRSKWIKVGELARVFTGANTIPGKRRVRKQLPAVFKRFLDLNEFLLYHTRERGRIEEIKLLDPDSRLDTEQALSQLERMQKRHELSAEKYEKAYRLMALYQAL